MGEVEISAARLRELRKEAGLTQDQLADRLGVSRVQVSRIERGISSTPMETILAWHSACGYRVSSIGLKAEQLMTDLTLAFQTMGEDDVRHLVRLARVWRKLTPSDRNVLAAIIGTHETD